MRPRFESELERILQSPAFEKAKRSQRLIAYLVEAALSDPPAAVKEYTLAVEVFDRPRELRPECGCDCPRRGGTAA